MLILPIKKQWFDKILSGEKKEEYREIKPYYTTRFIKELDPYVIGTKGRNVKLPQSLYESFIRECTAGAYEHSAFEIILRNGYSSLSPSCRATVTLRIDKGRPEWGAVPGVKYFVLQIEEVEEVFSLPFDDASLPF